VDIRDWNNDGYTNTINGTTTICVENYANPYRRRDKICVTLPSEFLTQRLLYMRLTDSGGVNFQRGCLSGMTVLREMPAPSVGLINRSFGKAPVAACEPTCCFVLWGKAHIIDSSTLTLDDGSGTPVTVIAPGYSGIAEGNFARAAGVFMVTGGQPTLTCPASGVLKL
jgi:hypothetical protein